MPRGETAPLHTSPDELFFGTAARDASRGLLSGSPKEIPARGAPEWPRVQSSAPRCTLCASALSSSAVQQFSSSAVPLRPRSHPFVPVAVLPFLPVSQWLWPASAQFTNAPRDSSRVIRRIDKSITQRHAVATIAARHPPASPAFCRRRIARTRGHPPCASRSSIPGRWRRRSPASSISRRSHRPSH